MLLTKSINEDPITLSPNPFDGQLQISGLPESTQVEMRIMGADSKVYWDGKQSTNDMGELSLMMDELQKGFYFISLRFEGKMEIFKIVKK